MDSGQDSAVCRPGFGVILGATSAFLGVAPYVFKACSLRGISAAEPDLDSYKKTTGFGPLC